MSDSEDYEDFGSGDESWDEEITEIPEIQRDEFHETYEDLKHAILS